MLGAVGALVFTIGLLLISLPLLRRLQRTVARSGAIPLEVMQRISTGPRQGVGLLRVGDRVLVVSLSERGTTMLTELTGDTLRQALESGDGFAGEGGVGTVKSRGGTGFLSRLFVAALLVLGPATAVAQDKPTQDPNAPKPAVPAPKPDAVQRTRPHVQAPPQVPGQVPVKPPVVAGPESPKIDFRIGEGNEQVRLTGTVGLVIFMGALALLPALFLLMTSFTRILIVLHFLRSALGTQTTPPGQLLVALAVLLTGVVMYPVLERANTDAIQPYMNGQMSQAEVYKKGMVPFREFMLANVREQDLASFAEMTGTTDADSLEALPTVTIVSAFITSELRTAFQMGFVIFLPFIVVDLIVASVLMSMGMFMLPPAMISLPFKLLLFVLADGWTLVVRSLLASFHGVPA